MADEAIKVKNTTKTYLSISRREVGLELNLKAGETSEEITMAQYRAIRDFIWEFDLEVTGKDEDGVDLPGPDMRNMIATRIEREKIGLRETSVINRPDQVEPKEAAKVLEEVDMDPKLEAEAKKGQGPDSDKSKRKEDEKGKK